MKPMQRHLLATAIVAALSASAYALPVHAQDTQGTTQKDKHAKELKKIVVTGSLIPTAEIDTATPVITITAQDIRKQGFTTIYQALRSQPLATGQIIGQQFTNGFTPGAEPSPSLLGLPPNFTLTLIDGHPIAAYPLLYNQSFGITDISSIPINMISSIQIVPGNQSSIYGSAAIAGVVNIILKHHISGVDFNYQGGGYSDGGGQTQNISMIGGYNHGSLSLTYGLQYRDQNPIWGFQRPLTASTTSNPDPYLKNAPFVSSEIFDYTNNTAIDPNSITPNACNALANEFGGTTSRVPVYVSARTNNPFQYVQSGWACGTPNGYGYATLQNKQRTASGYLNASFRINSNTEVYGNLIYTVNSASYYFGPNYSYWATNFPQFAFYNQNTGTIQQAFTVFSPEETGGLLVPGVTTFGRAFNFYGGIKGSVGSSNWNYDAYYARSQYNLYTNERQPITSKINAFFQNQFLGPKLGTSASGYPIYAPNYSNFFQPITPAQYQSFLGTNHTYSETYTQNVNLNVTNTDLFKVPAGHVGFAGVLQAGDQRLYEPLNTVAASGYFFNGSTGNAQGRRNNYAAAVEFRIPIFSMLTTDISARYDHFHNSGGASSSRPTYKVSLAFRPLHTLLLRADYATAFRMPPMGYAFIGPGTDFFSGITDYYQCELLNPGTPFSQCPNINNPNINYTTRGATVANPDLTSITAKSWGFGAVWSPTHDFNINVDYYDVHIANEVEPQSINSLLQTDAQCLLNQIPNTSAACQAAFLAILRNPAGKVTSYSVRPINVARERVSGITAGMNYRYDLGKYGELDLNGNYNVTLKHTFQLAPGQPFLDLLHNPYDSYLYAQGGTAYGPEFKSILNGSITWSIGPWSSTLYGIRYGKLPNTAAYTSPNVYQAYGAGRVTPWILYNATVRYNISKDARVSLTVNNLFNAMPPHDSTATSWPYYDLGAYNPFGRSYFVDFNYHF